MKSILIVEDSKDYSELLAKRLLSEGYKIFSAENGEEGIIIAQKEAIDLILLDILMPKVDGITFFNKLKNVLKKHVPVIVLTNLTETAAYDADIKAVLIKANVSLEDVVKKVKETLT